jgi:ABC-type uncharacterized transport system permease subunit
MKLYGLSPQLMAMDYCFLQRHSSLNPNYVFEAIHVHLIHDNVPLKVVESIIMLSFIQLLANCEIACAITPIDGNG